MEYEETYRGERIVISTEQQADGSWKSKSAWLKGDKRVSGEAKEETKDERYPSEEAARMAARSAAAEAIDRARVTTGKP